MKMPILKSLLTLFFFLFVVKSNGQEIFYSKDTIDASKDTSTLLKEQWQQLKQQFERGDIATTHPSLKQYQALSHQYGFRFENQFDQQKLHFKYHQLYDELYLLQDPSGSLSIDEIVQPEYQAKFIPNNSSDNLQRDGFSIMAMPSSYNPKDVYWVKLRAINPSAKNATAWLMLGWNERSWETIEVFRYNGNQIEKVGNSGLRLPLEDKMSNDWRNFIQLEVPAQKEYDYYFRLDGLFYPKYADRIDFHYFDEKTYWNNKSFSLFGNGIFLGMTFLLILFVAVLYYYSKEKDTLFFGIQLIGIWLHDFSDSENIGASNLHKEIFPGALEGGDILTIFGITMMIFGATFFPLAFLQAKKIAPKLEKWIARIAYIEIALYFSMGFFNLFLYPYFNYPHDWIIFGIYLFMLLLICLPILIFALAIIALRKRHPFAKIFLIAYFPIALVVLVFFSTEAFFNGALSTNQFHTSLRISHLVNYILFTIAIVYKRQIEHDQIIRKRLELGVQLRQQQQESQRLKELDAFKSRLYTNLTHEFRTPLTIILGMVNQMREAPKKYFDKGTLMIERNGKSLLHLINQLLDLSKLEDNSFQLNLKQSDIIPYLSYITEAFHTYANGKNLSLNFFSTTESLLMDFDSEQIKQVMTNLLSNALKYTPSGGTIKVRVTKTEQTLSLKIQDTGFGIDEKDLPYIFDRFYQGDNSFTRKGEGTGVGLAHTQELIKLMNGTIQASSQVGIGSTFSISLPITNDAPLETPINTSVKVNTITSDSILKSNDKNQIASQLPILLLIEDNTDVVIYLKSCLEDQFRVEVAYNGRIGIEKAVEIIPDLIISDVMMPEKDGYEVCDTLKNDERTSHIPIILLTARADMSSKIVGLRRGADAYLSKPFDKEELLVRSQMLIKKQKNLATHFSKNGTHNIIKTELEDDIKIEHAFIQKVTKIIEQHYSNDQFGLPQLCRKVGMSRSQLYRKMNALIETSPSSFIRTYRLQKAKHLLTTTDLNVSEVVWETGFTNLAHFTKIFREEFGVLPSSVKQ